MRYLIALSLLAFATPASAELYKWVDAQGRTHFSDVAPSAAKGTQPIGGKPAGSPGSGVNNNSSSKSAAPSPQGNDDTAERLQRQRRMSDILRQESEEREAAARKAEADKAKNEKDCASIRATLAKLDGGRLYVRNEKGEREFIDDETRSAYVDKYSNALKENCP